MKEAIRKDLTGSVLKEGRNEYLIVEGPAKGYAGFRWTCCEYYAQDDGEVYARGEHADVDAAYLSSLRPANRAVFAAVRDMSSYAMGYFAELGREVEGEDAETCDSRCRAAAVAAREADRALRSRVA